MTPTWRDGILTLLRLANRAFNEGETELGASLLVTALLAQAEVTPRR